MFLQLKMKVSQCMYFLYASLLDMHRCFAHEINQLVRENMLKALFQSLLPQSKERRRALTLIRNSDLLVMINQRETSKWAELGGQNVFSNWSDTMGFNQLLGLNIKKLLFQQFSFSFPIQLLVHFMNDIIKKEIILWTSAKGDALSRGNYYFSQRW